MTATTPTRWNDPFPNYPQAIGDKKEHTEKVLLRSPINTWPEYQEPAAKICPSKRPCTSIVIRKILRRWRITDQWRNSSDPTYMNFSLQSLQSEPPSLAEHLFSLSWALHQLESTATVSQSHAEQRKVLSKSTRFQRISRKLKFAVLAA